MEVVLRDEDESVLYRRQAPGEPSRLVLTPRPGSTSAQMLARMRREYALRADLNPLWAARPIAASSGEVVFEDPGGVLLDSLRHDELDLRRWLRVSAAIARAVDGMHLSDLVHRDIKPSNLLVDVPAGRAWLLGFGLAAHAHADPELGGVDRIAGTLAYMSPEQARPQGRYADPRSDLYSLGVTLYETLTGALPFVGADALDVVHGHLAQAPAPPAGVPLMVAAIVLKLLEKTPEQRYQSAASVEADLRRCLAELAARGDIEPFPLGMHDVPGQLRGIHTLYGRDRPLATLTEAFERIASGAGPELALVSGYSGVGKSSLVGELRRRVSTRALFASGKAEQFKRAVAGEPAAQLLRTLVGRMLDGSPDEVAAWRTAVAGAPAMVAEVLVGLVPELAALAPPGQAAAELPPQEAEQRLYTALRRLLALVGTVDHPLVLFLDDLQWLDTTTLKILEHLIAQPELRHILFVGAYRDNDPDMVPVLPRLAEAASRSGARLSEIVLDALASGELTALIADALSCPRHRVEPLAQLVQSRTGGVPFFAIQYLDMLVQTGLVTYESEANCWTWDADRLRDEGLAEGVVGLVL